MYGCDNTASIHFSCAVIIRKPCVVAHIRPTSSAIVILYRLSLPTALAMDDESSALVSEKSSQDESRNGATLAYPVQPTTDIFHTRDDSSMNAKSCMKYALALVTLGYAWFWLYDALYSSVPNSSYGRHPNAEYPDLYEASIEKLQIGLSRGLFTSVELTKVSNSRCHILQSRGFSRPDVIVGVYRTH